MSNKGKIIEVAHEIVQKEMATAPEKSISFYQFLKWHEGMSFFYLFKNKQMAIDLLGGGMDGWNGTVYSVILSQIIRDLITKGGHPDSALYLKGRKLLKSIVH
ncbi:hypothetical protein ACFY5J_01010 [Peribacillus butanolivorans]|uniref:hypothetical protein n=1 Tax=Peribacillus butanolivorans TaxID=421767 RepID=UPI0036702C47